MVEVMLRLSAILTALMTLQVTIFVSCDKEMCLDEGAVVERSSMENYLNELPMKKEVIEDELVRIGAYKRMEKSLEEKEKIVVFDEEMYLEKNYDHEVKHCNTLFDHLISLCVPPHTHSTMVKSKRKWLPLKPWEVELTTTFPMNDMIVMNAMAELYNDGKNKVLFVDFAEGVRAHPLKMASLGHDVVLVSPLSETMVHMYGSARLSGTLPRTTFLLNDLRTHTSISKSSKLYSVFVDRTKTPNDLLVKEVSEGVSLGTLFKHVDPESVRPKILTLNLAQNRTASLSVMMELTTFVIENRVNIQDTVPYILMELGGINDFRKVEKEARVALIQALVIGGYVPYKAFGDEFNNVWRKLTVEDVEKLMNHQLDMRAKSRTIIFQHIGSKNVFEEKSQAKFHGVDLKISESMIFQ